MEFLQHITLADVVIVVALALSVFLGSRKGLVKSLAGVVILVVAFIGAGFIADAMAKPVANWLTPLVGEKIQEQLALQEETADVGAFLESFTFDEESLQMLEELLNEFNFDGQGLENIIGDITADVEETGTEILRAITDRVAYSVSYALVYLLSFIVLLLALWLLMKPIYLVLKLPILRTVDALGGAALGLVWGALLTFLAVWALLRLDIVITQEMVASSTVLRFFATNSPLSLITSL